MAEEILRRRYQIELYMDHAEEALQAASLNLAKHLRMQIRRLKAEIG